MFIPNLGQGKKRPLYEQLYRYFRAEIECGKLKAGEKLPSRRQLSAGFNLSPGTVESAYSQLLAEGYIHARKQSGYYVSAVDVLSHFKRENRGADLSQEAREKEECAYQLKTNAVATEKFPFSTWAKLMRESLREDDRALLSPSPPQGDVDLREEIVRYLGKYRGIEAHAGQIVLGAGSEFLLTLLVQLLGRKRSYALENPGYHKIHRILDIYGARTVFIPLDEQGIRPEALEASDASVVHVTPSHHFPLATVMPVARRVRLLRWAFSGGGERYIIEDDYDSEFRFSGRPIPALQCLEEGRENVIYMNTFTKTLTPSLRISYMVLPERLLSVYRKNFSFYSCTVPNFEQRTLWRFLNRGHFERHLNRMKNVYRARRDVFLASLYAGCRQGVAISGENAGLHLLVSVNNGMNEEELVKSAEKNGVRLYGLSTFYAGLSADIPPSTVVVGYSGYGEEELAEAARLLSSAWFGC